MRDLNVDFFDMYKDVDNIIKQAYDSEEGVSVYLNQMDNHYNEAGKVNGWKEDYKRLKDSQRMRNQLAHDLPFDSNVCDKYDYQWLSDFKQRLYHASDPLSMLRKQEQKQTRTNNQRRKPEISVDTYNTYVNDNTYNQSQENYEHKPHIDKGWLAVALVIIALMIAFFFALKDELMVVFNA